MTVLSGIRIDAPSIVNSGETATIRLTILDADVDPADVELYVVPPGANEVDKTTSLSDVSATLTLAGVTSEELSYEFDGGEGVYLFVAVDTGVGGKSYFASSHCLGFAGDIGAIKTDTTAILVDTASILGDTGPTKTDTANILANVSTAMPTGAMKIGFPSFVGKGEQAILRLWWAGVSTTLTNVSIYVVPPLGGVVEITNHFIHNPTASVAGAVMQFDGRYTFELDGGYAFVIVNDNVTPKDVYLGYAYCAPWTTRIDQPISDFNKLRTEVQRNLSRASQRR